MFNKKQIKNFILNFWATTSNYTRSANSKHAIFLKNSYYSIKSKILKFCFEHPKKVEFILNFIFRQFLSFLCNIDLYVNDCDFSCMLETIKLEEKFKLSEMKKIIQTDIQPAFEANPNNAITRTPNGKIDLDHLIILSSKMFGTMHDDVHLYIYLDKTLPKNETPVVTAYIGDLNIFNHAEYNSVVNYISEDLQENEKSYQKKNVLEHVIAITDHIKIKHCKIIIEYKFPSGEIRYIGYTITTNPITETQDPVAVYYGNVLSEHYTQTRDFVIKELTEKPIGTKSYIAHTPQYFRITEKEILKYQEYYFSEIKQIQQELQGNPEMSKKLKRKITNLFQILNIHHNTTEDMQHLVQSMEKKEIFQLVQEKATNLNKYTLKTPQAQQTFEEITEKIKTKTYVPEFYEQQFKNFKFSKEPGKYAIDTAQHNNFVIDNYKTFTKLATSIRHSTKI